MIFHSFTCHVIVLKMATPFFSHELFFRSTEMKNELIEAKSKLKLNTRISFAEKIVRNSRLLVGE